jgi:hypothetical protein
MVAMCCAINQGTHSVQHAVYKIQQTSVALGVANHYPEVVFDVVYKHMQQCVTERTRVRITTKQKICNT